MRPTLCFEKPLEKMFCLSESSLSLKCLLKWMGVDPDCMNKRNAPFEILLRFCWWSVLFRCSQLIVFVNGVWQFHCCYCYGCCYGCCCWCCYHSGRHCWHCENKKLFRHENVWEQKCYMLPHLLIIEYRERARERDRESKKLQERKKEYIIWHKNWKDHHFVPGKSQWLFMFVLVQDIRILWWNHMSSFFRLTIYLSMFVSYLFLSLTFISFIVFYFAFLFFQFLCWF